MSLQTQRNISRPTDAKLADLQMPDRGHFGDT